MSVFFNSTNLTTFTVDCLDQSGIPYQFGSTEADMKLEKVQDRHGDGYWLASGQENGKRVLCYGPTRSEAFMYFTEVLKQQGLDSCRLRLVKSA